jgi:hypothetical protein
MLRVIAIALVGVLLTEAGWWIVDELLIDSPAVPARLTTSADLLAGPLGAVHTSPQPGSRFDVFAGGGFSLQAEAIGGPLTRGWAWLVDPVRQWLHASTWPQWFGLLLDAAWAIAVWALFGGAIARIAGLYLAYGETIGPIDALKSAAARWRSFAAAPTFALLATWALSLPLMFAGVLARVDFLALVLGLIWLVVILGGLVVAFLAIGLALGWPLMTATIAVERTDAFDGISRGYAYVYQRPLHALFYVIIAGLLGLMAQAAVNLIVGSTIDATQWAVAAGAGRDRAADFFDRVYEPHSGWGSPTEVAAKMIRFWMGCFAAIAQSFPLAYLWSAAVGIYLLLRRQIDATDLGEIIFDEGEPKPGLPTLEADPATGVPHVAEPSPSTRVPPSETPPTETSS